MSSDDSSSGAGDDPGGDTAPDPRASMAGAQLAQHVAEATKADAAEIAAAPEAAEEKADAAAPAAGGEAQKELTSLWDMPTKTEYEGMSVEQIMNDMVNPQTAEAEQQMEEVGLPTDAELIAAINDARKEPEVIAQALEQRLKWYSPEDKLFGFPDKKVKLDPYEEDAAYKEAIEYLRNEVAKAGPLEPLGLEKGLSLACGFQTSDGKNTGQCGHMSSRGKWQFHTDGVLIDVDEGESSRLDGLHAKEHPGKGHKDHGDAIDGASWVGCNGESPVDRMEKYGKFEEGNVAESINYPRKDYKAQDIILGFIADDGVKSRANRLNIFNAEMKKVGMSVDEHKDRGRMCVMLFCEKYETDAAAADTTTANLDNEFGDLF